MVIVGLDLSLNGSGCVKMELDDELNIINRDYLGFTQVKKNSSKNVLFYSKKDFRNYFEQNEWMKNNILYFCKDAEYCAVEDYAFSALGRITFLAEFEGLVKYSLYMNDKKLRLYDIASIKMFACNNGTATKEDMIDKYYSEHSDILKLNYLPKYKSPKEDICDAFWICNLLLMELKLRKGLISLKSLTEKQIQIFNRTTKSSPQNILSTDFLERV